MKLLALLLVSLAALCCTFNARAATFDATITWTDNSTNESGFRIYRKTGATGTYAQIGQVGPNITSFIDPGLTPNTTYFYQIGAFNSIDEKKGPEASAVTGAPTDAAPGAPTIIFIYKP